MMDAVASAPLEAISPLLAPISAEAPTGEDLSYDPDFERLIAEIAKLTSLSGELPDWRFVLSESERTLKSRSKDLRAMSWLVVAKAHLDGWSGIAAGLTGYAALTKAFWPSLFPAVKRTRARAGQVEWLWGALARRIAALPITASDAEIVRSLEPKVAELGAFFSEQLKDADPGMGAVRAALREKIRSSPEPAPAAAPAPEPAPDTRSEAESAMASATAGGLAGTPSDLANGASTTNASNETANARPAAPVVAPPEIAPVALDPSALASLDQAQDAARRLRDPLLTMAHHARQVAPSSPWGYRLLRLAAWLTVERAPEAEGTKTPLRAPKEQDRELLETLRDKGQWDGLLEAAEDAAATHVFWLDVHRMTALALEGKGAEFRLARQTVIRETVAFVERASGVTRLLFSNGTPFAGPETVEWLEASASVGSRDRGGATAAGAQPDEGLDALLATLDDRLASGAAEDALARALIEVARLPTTRGRFRARLAVARRAQAAEHLDVALALYERMLPEITKTLEAWEPALAAELIASYLKALRLSRRSAGRGDREADEDDRTEARWFQKLLALDPHAALRLRS